MHVSRRSRHRADLALTENIIRGEVPGGYGYQKHSYVEADARLLLEKWLVDGLGHAWPGSPKPSKYADPKGPNAQCRNLALLLRSLAFQWLPSLQALACKSGEASK